LIPERAETLIVGGGISGVALAYYLAAGGAAGVVLLEREQLASGSTGSSFGGVRQQFSSPLEIELSKRGLRFWKSVQSRFGHPCPFAQDGYLVVTARPAIAELLAEAAALQSRLEAGPVHLLDHVELRSLAPWLLTDDVVAASWTPEDGRVTPTDGVAALAAAARELGVQIVEGWPVQEVQPRPAGGMEVRGRGSIAAERIVVAAGSWSAELVRPFGVELGVYPLTAYYALTGPALTGLRVPVTIDMDTGMVVEREGDGLAVIVDRDVDTLPPDYGAQDFLQDFTTSAQRRAPTLQELPITRTASAVIDMSTDGHPWVGQVEERLWVMAGFAGHGTMHGPAVAELLAGIILGAPDHAVDVAPLDPHDRSQVGNEWMAHGGTSTHHVE
jgi:sarcosine oxidase subunit beta